MDELRDELKRLGLNPAGTMQLRSGITGEELYNSEVFMGVCYYQRLKQLAEAKARAVDRGVRSSLTRQPMEGKNGGLRAGEMERDAFIAHGAPEIVTNTYLVRSDDYVAYACTQCGLLSCPPRQPDPSLAHFGTLRDDSGYCTNCRTSEHVARFRTPYALKLMMQELMTLGVVPRLDIHTSSTVDFANAPSAGVPTAEHNLPMTSLGISQAAEEAPRSSPHGHGPPHHGHSPPPPPQQRHNRATAVDSLPGGTLIKGPDILDEEEGGSSGSKAGYGDDDYGYGD